MKALSYALILMSLSGPTLSASPAAAQAKAPPRDWVAGKVRVTLRTQEYRRKINFLFAQRLEEWSRSFIARRHDGIQRAGHALAAEAEAIRTARPMDWTSVGEDPEFHAFEQAQLAALLEPRQLREELQAWAVGVERDTRALAVELSRQLIAEDLGLKFDERLRGTVVRAVSEIPLESLVNADTAWIERRISSGLPPTLITPAQRTAISAAAGALAAAGAGLAVASHAPALAGKVAALALVVGRWLAELALENLDREISGKPDPARLAANLEGGLREWQDRRLRKRMELILQDFGDQLVELIEKRALVMNLGKIPT